MASLFLSYARDDIECIRPLAKALELTLTDGRVIRERCDIPRGDARAPLNDQELAAKIAANPSFAPRAGGVPLKVGDDLIGAIDEYINRHNENPRPFIWTASANDILAKVKRARSRGAKNGAKKKRASKTKAKR